MSITSSTVGKSPPDVFKTKYMMMARVLETLWDKVQYVDHGIKPRNRVDIEAIGWYRGYMRSKIIVDGDKKHE